MHQTAYIHRPWNCVGAPLSVSSYQMSQIRQCELKILDLPQLYLRCTYTHGKKKIIFTTNCRYYFSRNALISAHFAQLTLYKNVRKMCIFKILFVHFRIFWQYWTTSLVRIDSSWTSILSALFLQKVQAHYHHHLLYILLAVSLKWGRPCMIIQLKKINFHCFVEWFIWLFANCILIVSVIQGIYFKISLMCGGAW